MPEPNTGFRQFLKKKEAKPPCHENAQQNTDLKNILKKYASGVEL